MKIFKQQLSILLALLILFGAFAVGAEGKFEADNKQYTTLSEPITLNRGEEAQLVVELSAGAYEFSPVFRPVSQTAQAIEYSVLIDGTSPFSGAERLSAQVWFEDEGGFGVLSSGDQTAPRQKPADGFMESFAYDKTGVNKEHYAIDLSGEKQLLTIRCLGEAFELSGFAFRKKEELKSYKEFSDSNKDKKNYSGKAIAVEGEKPYLKNDYSLTAKADNSSVKITPNNSKNSVINFIGGENWSKPFQEIIWEIDVPEDRLYAIEISFKQNSIINGCAFRTLKIDGVCPFSEAKELSFDYKTAWQQKRLTDKNGEELLFYLTRGTHKISLSVNLGSVAEIYGSLKAATERVGEMYLDIVMITGETPDANRDYELYKQIPDYEKSLGEMHSELSELSKVLKSSSDVNGELDASVRNMMRVIKQMRDERYNSHLYLDTYYSYYQTLSSWLFDIKDMSLSVDKIILCAPESECDIKPEGAFSSMVFTLKRFIASFAGDYAVNSLAESDAESIKIWVNWGRDQVKILNALIGRSFSSKTGINVRVEQVNASLIQGIVSNNSPDLYLQLSRTEPVNLAMRGVLEDLSEFEDFEEVLSNFMPGAETPYLYNGGCYALPDTQSFNVMFCRSDILNQLGIPVPETWEDFISATSAVQRKNMNVYLPYTRITSATTVNVGVGGLSIFPTLMLQNGQELYNSEQNETTLSSPIAVEAFRFWTDFYTRYKLDPDVSFYQRFRVGTIPLGISGYANYLTFSVAAPEIEGKWSIYPIPGTVREDGSVNHTTSGAGTGCAIMKSSKNKKAAWEFLKWWVSEETQYSYSSDIEAVLGPSGRIDTANVKALSRLSWNGNALDSILYQWKNVKEIPEVPGSYYVSRSIDQAFWVVYNEEMLEKEAISEWGKVSDLEIKRKLAEYPITAAEKER